MEPNQLSQTRCNENDPMNNRINLGRLSMSDANLHASEHHRNSLEKAQSQLNITPSSRSGLVPLSATIKENKELKNELEICRAQLQVANYREREARSLLSKDVNDIIEEYFKLQLISVETDEKLRELNSLHETLNQVTLERNDALRDLYELQQVAQQNMEHYESQFVHLNRQLESGRTQGSTEFEDFTLASSLADSDLAEEKVKLKDALEENIKLSELSANLQTEVDTLKNALSEMALPVTLQDSEVYSNNSAMTDELKNVNEKMAVVIQNLLQHESALIKKIKKYEANELLNETPQLEFSDKNEMLNMVSKLQTDLNNLRSANWEMRAECARIKGEHLENSLVDSRCFENNLGHLPLEDNTSSTIDEYMSQAKGMLDQMKNNYGIDLNATNCVVPKVENMYNISRSELHQASTVNENVSSSLMNGSQAYVNASFAEVLQVSMHTAEDVRQFKVKLDTLKELFVSMFERLKGSAAVFEEVYKYLANGSAENKELADKIQQMKLEFSTFSSDDSKVEKAVAEAERSMTQLQANLSVLEQSLNQSTSFIFDASRRASIGANQSKADNRLVSDAADKNVISELQEKSAADEATIMELKNLINKTKTSLVEVTEARDNALSSVDSLRQRLERLDNENEDIKQQNNAQNLALENSQCTVSELKDRLQKLTEDTYMFKEEKVGVEKKLAKTTKDMEESQQQNLDLEQELQDIKQAVCKKCRTKTSRVTSRALSWIRTKFARSEITQRLILTTEELEKTKTDLIDRKAAFEELCLAKEECINKLSQIELDNHHLRNKFTEIELIARRKESAIAAERDRVVEEAAAARETMQLLGQRIEELEAALEVFESKNAYDDKKNNKELEMSCLARANNVNKSSETVITSQAIDVLCNQKDELQKELEKLHSIYINLATAIYNYVTPCSPPDQLYNRDIDAIKSASEELVELLQEAGEKNNSALEQIDYIIASQEIQRNNVSHNSAEDSASILKYKHQETVIDDLHYSSKLRQDLYTLTTFAMDLTANIKSAQVILGPKNKKVDLARILNDSRKLRGELHNLYTIIGRSDKENSIPKTMHELVDMNRILSAQNEHLHKSLKDNRAKLQEINNQVTHPSIDPAVLQMIPDELAKIEKVMSATCETVRKASVLGKK